MHTLIGNFDSIAIDVAHAVVTSNNPPPAIVGAIPQELSNSVFQKGHSIVSSSSVRDFEPDFLKRAYRRFEKNDTIDDACNENQRSAL